MAQHLTLLLFVFGCTLSVISAAEKVRDLEASASIASDYKVQSVAPGSSGKYGYPYLIAPTLAPVIQARSDDDDKETVSVAKTYGTRISGTTDDIVKKGSQKKSKVPYVYEATRRQDNGDASVEKRFRSYWEPKYRNFDELEDAFLPKRRIDVNFPYSQYEYSKPGRKPSVSPRDPYLSPSAEPVDAFYPSAPKIKNVYSTSYGSHSNRDSPSYGAGRYEDPSEYHVGSYGAPPSGYQPSGGSSLSYPSSGGPSLSYPSSGGPSPSYPSGGSYDYHDNYSIKSNEPIMGDIRKKLLDYAGASDLYEGEPDYLRQVARNKYKYGSLGNDYYTYGGQGYRDSYREFPYVESKISLIKKSRGL